MPAGPDGPPLPPSTALLLFAKLPEPGKVKTRLARAIGTEGAARIAEAFLLDAAAHWSAIPACAPIVAADDPDHPFWRTAFPPPWRIEPQGEGDLGARLARAFARELARFDRVAAIGADHPALPAAAVARFFREESAVWPARDGGYAAILLSRAAAARLAMGGIPGAHLFEAISWSTPQVLAQTLARAAARGVALAELPETGDVDEAGDLDDLERELASRDPESPDFPRRTWEALRRIRREARA
ncbi:MAG TPA: TIGR04282 family arsenosugar biosynthesis glycosyltransferase [Thermoanaerobaculia bacterium]|nr:TIGR04282 family arsenosugar biosynthesis glycosyltransferase [Thermoanaerobaculia bacterium]